MAAKESSSRRWKYDVFLSFRGEDTRKSFTDHLYISLKDAGVDVFRDDNELRRGEDIATELLTAIEGSRISLIVFSRNYADSRWCLEELEKIMECKNTNHQLVLPVFYDVDPSDVQKQTGSFGDAFAKHEKRFVMEMEKIGRWRVALTEAGSLSGWDLRNTADGHEAKMIKKIVEAILNELNHTYFNIAIYPVGIDSRVQKMNSLLSIGSNDVRIVGICGMGGLGKTTIAKAVYNQFFHSFEGKSFLANVGEISKQHNGLVLLQEQLLSDILKVKKIKIRSVDRGISVIKERLRNRRILLVLDDVDHSDQLKMVAGMHDWFGLGSRIIITTRDEHLLKEIGVDKIYMMKEMDDDESLELFSWHAFRNSHPTKNYGELSKEVVDYSKGVPLALEVLGCFLVDRTLAEWKCALERLKSIPHDQVQRKLRVSFDALADDIEKDIFLDIACFFIGVKKDYAIKILDSFDFFAEIGISVLTRRCLLRINEKDELMMHNLLRDMGREIVREESPKNPGKRSRLWLYPDILDVLTNHKGTKAVEGLLLRLPQLDQVHELSTEAFSTMKKLRLLQLDHVRLVGSYGDLPKELRFLCWHRFHLKFIPNNFNMENLVIIELQYSNLCQVWSDGRMLRNLKVLNLSHSPYLTKTPDFMKLPNLERLILKDCKSLVALQQSIGQLDQMIVLNISGCKNLKNLPRGICKLKSLEKLNLRGCSRINILPEDLGDMESLIVLRADETAITRVPCSVVRLKNLRKLSFGCFKGNPSCWLPSIFRYWVPTRTKSMFSSLFPTSLLRLSSLTTLILSDRNLSDDILPKDIGCLSSLEELDLSSNNFRSLPATISNLSKLQVLVLDYCSNLQSLPEDIGQLSSLQTLELTESTLHYLPASISFLTNLYTLRISQCTNLKELPELPTSLLNLFASECTSLEKMSNLSHTPSISSLFLRNCHKLIDIPGLQKLKSIGKVYMDGCSKLSETFKDGLLQDWSGSSCRGILVPGIEIPSWFSYKSNGPLVCFQVPHILGNKIKGFTVCFVITCNMRNELYSFTYCSITLSNLSKVLEWTEDATIADRYIPGEDQMSMSHFPHRMFGNQIDVGDELKVEVLLEDHRLRVKMCGVHVVLEQDERHIPEVEGKSILPITYEAGGNANKRSYVHYEDPSHEWSSEEQEPKRLRYE